MKIDKEFTWSDVWVGEGYISSCNTTVWILLVSRSMVYILFNYIQSNEIRENIDLIKSIFEKVIFHCCENISCISRGKLDILCFFN